MDEPRRSSSSSARDRAPACTLLFACLFALLCAPWFHGCSAAPPAPDPVSEEQRVAAIRGLEASHRFRAALVATDEWLATEPGNAQALDWKTRLLRELGDERRALEVVLARRANEPRDAAVAFEAGELLAHVGAPERALAAFDDARALAPDDWRPAVAAAALLLLRTTPDVAGAEQRLAPFIDGPHAAVEARFHLALALEAAGDPVGSSAALDHALELDPQHVPSLQNLALFRERTGDVAGALDCWRRVKRSSAPDDARFTRELDHRIDALKERQAATLANDPAR